MEIARTSLTESHTARQPRTYRWLALAAAALFLLAAGAVALAIARYRADGTVVYPSIGVIDYSLNGRPFQPLALAGVAASLALLWAALRWRRRALGLWAVLGMLLSVIGFLVIGSPFRHVTTTRVAGTLFQLSETPTSKDPALLLYVLFRCDATGIVCREVSVVAPFDQATGRWVSGTPRLTPGPHGTVAIRIGSATIGTFDARPTPGN